MSKLTVVMISPMLHAIKKCTQAEKKNNESCYIAKIYILFKTKEES